MVTQNELFFKKPTKVRLDLRYAKPYANLSCNSTSKTCNWLCNWCVNKRLGWLPEHLNFHLLHFNNLVFLFFPFTFILLSSLQLKYMAWMNDQLLFWKRSKYCSAIIDSSLSSLMRKYPFWLNRTVFMYMLRICCNKNSFTKYYLRLLWIDIID